MKTRFENIKLSSGGGGFKKIEPLKLLSIFSFALLLLTDSVMARSELIPAHPILVPDKDINAAVNNCEKQHDACIEQIEKSKTECEEEIEKSKTKCEEEIEKSKTKCEGEKQSCLAYIDNQLLPLGGLCKKICRGSYSIGFSPSPDGGPPDPVYADLMTLLESNSCTSCDASLPQTVCKPQKIVGLPPDDVEIVPMLPFCVKFEDWNNMENNWGRKYFKVLPK